jgi:hypothetical protein
MCNLEGGTMKRLTQYVLLAALAASVLGIVLAAQPADDQLLEAFDKARFIEAHVFHYNRRSCR